MAFALKRHGSWWIGYADQTGRAAIRRSSAISLSHAHDAAAKLEEMSRRLREAAEARQAAADLREVNAQLLAALKALAEDIEGQVDVKDGDYETGPSPNWAMRLMQDHGARVAAAIAKAEGK